MVMYGKIRRMFCREHLTISETQRCTSLSRNTIRKWLRAPSDSAVKYYRPKIPGKLTPFEPKLLLTLGADVHRPKKDRRTALMLFAEIKKEGYTGSYTMATDFIRQWRNQGATDKSVYVPLRFELGEAFQFDWSEEHLVIVVAFIARFWLLIQSYAPVVHSCCRAISHRVTKCCSMRILEHLLLLAEYPGAASTTT